MNGKPIIELRIKGMEQEINQAIMLRHDEISEQVKEGVERALANAPSAIVDVAVKEASNTINREVENYFRYGPGYKAIQAVIEVALKPLTEALSK